MSMNFDRSGDPNPIPADLAVKRGVLLINWPVRLIMFGGFALARFLGDKLPLLAIIIGLLAIPMALVVLFRSSMASLGASPWC